MKKYILLLSLILGSILSYGQVGDYKPMGNALQRATDGTGFKYRFSLGSPGFYNITDSIRNALTFSNGLTKKGNNVTADLPYFNTRFLQNNNTGTPQSASFNINGIGRFDSPTATTLFGPGIGSFSTEAGVTAINGGSVNVGTELITPDLATSDSSSKAANTKFVKQALRSNNIYYNVKDYGAVGDSIKDNTPAIRAAIAAMPASGGNLFFPDGIYKITYGIELNKPITVLGNGTIKQETDSTQIPGGAFPYSRFPVFKIMSNNVKIQDITIKPKFEAVETLGFDGLTIDNVKIIGRRISKFAGIFLKDTKNVYVNNTLVTKIGTKAFDGDRAGHAIHINTAENIRVNNCELVDNGSNGVFCFVSSDIWITNNNINYNGLSATQFSFAGNPAYRQRNYHIVNNNMEYNSADAVDVNDLNEIGSGPREIDMFITGNKSIGNGFFQGSGTPDGSGVATLLNVASVLSTGNISKNNNTHGFYIYNSKNITSLGDQIISPNLTGFYIESSDSISISNANVNSIGSSLRFTGANSNVKIFNNNFKTTAGISLDYPNGNTLTNYDISYNSFVGVGTINGLINLSNNYIESTTENNAFGIFADNITLRGNTIKAQNIAIIMTSRTGITLENNTFIGGLSAAAAIISESNVTMRGNKLQSIGTNPALFVNGASTLNMFFNDIGATGVGNNIRLDPGAPIVLFQDKNLVHDGYPEYGSATVNNVVYDGNVPSQVQNNLNPSTTIAPSATAVNSALSTSAKWQGESVSTSSKAVGDLISYNGTNWINKAITATSPLSWNASTSNMSVNLSAIVQNSMSSSTTIAPSTSAVLAYVSSGTYTPTLTIFNNATSVTADLCHYIKIGDQVTVSGQYTTTTGASAVLDVIIKVSLPIASNFTAANDLTGNGSIQITTNPANVTAQADTTDDVATVRHGSTPAATSGVVTYFTFTYTIK